MKGYDELSNAMRGQAILMAAGTVMPRFCTISSYDGKMAVKVMVQPENVESGWMPVGCIGVGNGFGVAVGPSVGDFVIAVFAEGDFNSGSIVGRFFTTENQPMAVPSNEIWAVHKTGSFVKMTNDGKVAINGQVEIDANAPAIKIAATGNVDVTAGGNATITATGNATISAAIAAVTATSSASVAAPSISLGAAGQAVKSFLTDAFIALFNGHNHNVSGGVTLVPNQQASAAHATTTVKGG